MTCGFKELEPEEFVCFKNKIIIKKVDARKYEQELKQELCDWIVQEKDKVTVTKHIWILWKC